MRSTFVKSFLLIAFCGQLASWNNGKAASIESEFNEYYRQWKQQCREILTSSDTFEFINLPAFRAIVSLGTPAISFIRQKLQEDAENPDTSVDCFLAFAVAEIMGWDPKDYYNRPGNQSEQGFRDYVLEKLKAADHITTEGTEPTVPANP
jgi:predicted alpha/beta hydrolase